jgi:hypothetical protein
MWQVNRHNPACGHSPLNPGACRCSTFIGAPNGKSREAAHVTSESTPLSVQLLFFTEIITVLVVETNLAITSSRQFWRRNFSPTWGDRSGNVCVLALTLSSHVFSEGHDTNRGIQMCQVWSGTVWTKVVSKITTQKTTYKTSFRSFFMETVGASTRMYVKEHGYLQLF